MTELPFQLLYSTTLLRLDDDWIATTLDVDSVATSQRLLLDKGIAIYSHHCLITHTLSHISNIFKTKSTIVCAEWIYGAIYYCSKYFANVGQKADRSVIVWVGVIFSFFSELLPLQFSISQGSNINSGSYWIVLYCDIRIVVVGFLELYLVCCRSTRIFCYSVF